MILSTKSRTIPLLVPNPLVRSIEEIKHNIIVLDGYLESKCDPEYSFALNLVRRGRCFIAVRTEEGYKFYPSRFIGYADNTMHKHKANEDKDGKDTNPEIRKILKQREKENPKLEAAYIDYCRCLGFTEYQHKRKYWEFDRVIHFQ